MENNKPFGLVIPKKASTFQPKTIGVFGSDSDDDIPPKKKFAKIPQSKPISSIKIDETVDPSIYEYDTVYDDIKAQKIVDVAPKVNKSSRYIDNLLKAADKRKKEYERRIEKKVQVEREKEGNKYEDKEMFVTSAYKKKMQEREEEEERERRENMLNDMMDVTKQKDLSGFYRHFLKQSVGEEKIPVFGEKVTIKEEPQSESDGGNAPHIDKNLPTEPKEVYDDKDLSESDDSDSDKSDHDSYSKNSYEKSVREYRKRPLEESSDDEAINSSENFKFKSRKENSQKKSSRKEKSENLGSKSLSSRRKHNYEEESKSLKNAYRKSPKRSTDEEYFNKSSKSSKSSDVFYRKSHKIKSNSHNVTHQELEASKASDLSASDTSSDKKLSSNGSQNGVKEDKVSSEIENSKNKKINIFVKRNIDGVFAAAQARYFQRLATRSR